MGLKVADSKSGRKKSLNRALNGFEKLQISLGKLVYSSFVKLS